MLKITNIIISSTAAIVMLLTSFQPAMAGGIPVIDVSNITQSITNSIKQIAEMTKQLTELQRQYDQMVKQYTSMTGGRGLGTIMNDSSNKNYLPDDWKTVYDRINSGGYTGLSNSGKSVRSSNQTYDICKNMVLEQKKACERQASLAYQDRANSGDAYEKAKARLAQIESLMKHINSTQDQKEILELNARLQAEQAMIKNEAIKLQMYQMVAGSEKRLADQQQHEVEVKEFSRRGGVKMEPLNLGGQ
jgi:type IV secretion system protein VirB5